MKQAHSLDWAHPLVSEWFIQQVGEPTEPQRQGWPSILAGNATLISAPTGSGKTFAAFLACLDQLIRKALNGTLTNETEVLYVSPLKALGNDIQKNLMTPLNGIIELAETYKQTMAEITVSVRSGDTPAKERAAMAKKPPHILVTTPESLYILLTTEKSREILRSVKTVIVDEIHALANNKRGSHLSLSLERLEAITHQSPVRIGLSATQKPLEQVADFLMGQRDSKATIINIGHARHLELTVEVPSSELGAVASNEMWDEIYNRLAELAKQNRSTLIFANTRRVAERVAHHLTERLGPEQVAAHHGSLSRKLRLQAESKLKNGELKALVATASLELGIDIGSVDLVCQLGSPRSIAVMLQRVGRAGHWHGAVSKGRLFVTTRDELLECAALVQAIREGDLDRLIIPEEPLDILAQQIIASTATDEWQEDDLFALITRAYPYRALSRQTFDELLEMLAEGITGSRGRYSAYLFRDRVSGRVKGRRGSRLTAITNGGAIPENGLFTVITEPTGAMVGTLDEDFAVESNRGDIILLGSTSWQIRRIESTTGRVLVEDAHGAPPTVPFWRGEAPGRTRELSLQVSALRQCISDLLPAECSPVLPVREQLALTQAALEWLQSHCQVNQAGAEQLLEYILQGRALLGAVPTQQRVIAERFFDEAGGMQLIIHAPFGARINKAWGLALRKCFCRSFNFELQASATDDGINIALAEQHSFPLADVFAFLHPKSITKVLTQAVLQSPLFATRWRWDAGRALALIRFRNGKKVPPNIQRMLANDLLAAVFPDAAACQDNLGGRDIELPNHPLINETIKDALTEALDLEGLIDVLEQLKRGDIQYLAVDTPTPSAFAHEILNANPYAFLDDAPLEERRARAVTMRRILPDSLLEEIGKLDGDIIAEVKQQVWPDVRDADELQDALQTLIALPVDYIKALKLDSLWQPFFNELRQKKRAGIAMMAGKMIWFAVEKAQTFANLYCQALISDSLPTIEEKPLSREDALIELIRGWMFSIGPVRAQELADILHLNLSETEQALLRLEASGVVLRGSFRSTEQEWCERRVLARIHRLTLGKLRREIEPVTPIKFMQWLLTWQHVTPGTQLRDEQGLIEVISQLQGFEIPAKSWEKEIFAKRVNHYDPGLLDRLCLMGIIGWGRLSKANEIVTENKRVIPTSVAPITFFVRDRADWMPVIQPAKNDDELQHLSHVARHVYSFLQNQGASFFHDIAQGVPHLQSEIEMALWELVTAGLTTADGFDNLRSLIDPRRRLNKKRRHPLRHQYSTGRWSLLKTPIQTDANIQTEALCWLLLKRYGVVFRDLIVREKLIPSWRELLIAFRRLEARGEIRGGRFVSGFLGEQFALPYAIDSLRAIKNKEPHREAIRVAAVDPLNVVGLILPGQRIAAFAGKQIIFKGNQYYEDNRPVLNNPDLD